MKKDVFENLKNNNRIKKMLPINNAFNKEELKDMSSKLTQEKMMTMLDWAYNQTITGLPKQKDIYEFTKDYTSKYEPEVAIKKLVNFQTTKAATSGFLTGFGGVLVLPVSIPANIATVILFQMRMIAAIAVIRGYDLNSDQVKTFVYATLAGSSLSDIMKNTGIIVGNKLMLGVLKKIPGDILIKINKAVGFRLVTKFGTKGAINLWKVVPVAGGVVGGIFDVTTTRSIALLAKRTFSNEGIDIGDGTIITVNKNGK